MNLTTTMLLKSFCWNMIWLQVTYSFTLCCYPDRSGDPPKSRSNSRRPSLSDEKDVLVLQVTWGVGELDL